MLKFEKTKIIFPFIGFFLLAACQSSKPPVNVYNMESPYSETMANPQQQGVIHNPKVIKYAIGRTKTAGNGMRGEHALYQEVQSSSWNLTPPSGEEKDVILPHEEQTPTSALIGQVSRLINEINQTNVSFNEKDIIIKNHQAQIDALQKEIKKNEKNGQKLSNNQKNLNREMNMLKETNKPKKSTPSYKRSKSKSVNEI